MDVQTTSWAQLIFVDKDRYLKAVRAASSNGKVINLTNNLEKSLYITVGVRAIPFVFNDERVVLASMPCPRLSLSSCERRGPSDENQLGPVSRERARTCGRTCQRWSFQMKSTRRCVQRQWAHAVQLPGVSTESEFHPETNRPSTPRGGRRLVAFGFAGADNEGAAEKYAKTTTTWYADLGKDKVFMLVSGEVKGRMQGTLEEAEHAKMVEKIKELAAVKLYEDIGSHA